METQLKLFNQSVLAEKKSSQPKKVVIAKTELQEKKSPRRTPNVTLLVFVDGAARGNPGQSGAGIYITTQDKVPLIKKGYYLKHQTNNQAEYLALILACIHVNSLIKNEPETHVIFHSDSQLLVRQIQGIYKVKNEILIQLHKIARDLLKSIPYSIVHVEREFNVHADKLANLGIDKKVKIPQAVANVLQLHDVIIE